MEKVEEQAKLAPKLRNQSECCKTWKPRAKSQTYFWAYFDDHKFVSSCWRTMITAKKGPKVHAVITLQQQRLSNDAKNERKLN